jgi:O-antigen/teichoic acid export membrane protein
MLWLSALVLTWPMAIFYHDPQQNFCFPLSRHMGVRQLFAIDGSTSVVSLVVTIAWAYYRPSVWAIVAGRLISTIYRLGISFIPKVAPGIRNSFCWDWEAVHSIVHFGKWLMIATAFTFFATQSDRLIMGG